MLHSSKLIQKIKAVKLPPNPQTNAARAFKRGQTGLYDGRIRGTGFNVSHAENHTKRTWLPNVQRKKLWSETLQEWRRVSVTTSALRSIDKAGGLDAYLSSAHDDVLGLFGRKLRREVLEEKRRAFDEEAEEEHAEEGALAVKADEDRVQKVVETAENLRLEDGQPQRA